MSPGTGKPQPLVTFESRDLDGRAAGVTWVVGAQGPHGDSIAGWGRGAGGTGGGPGDPVLTTSSPALEAVPGKSKGTLPPERRCGVSTVRERQGNNPEGVTGVIAGVGSSDGSRPATPERKGLQTSLQTSFTAQSKTCFQRARPPRSREKGRCPVAHTETEPSARTVVGPHTSAPRRWEGSEARSPGPPAGA